MSTSEDIPVVEAESIDEKNEDRDEKDEREKRAEGSDSGADYEDTCRMDDSGDIVGEFVYSFGHGFVQAPIDGVREIVNTLSGTKIVPKIEVVKPPKKKEIATPEWQAQKVGAGCGLIVSLVVISNMISKGRPI
ncbi:hypothetical protein GC174_09800 [bacterium]|nr:hypothetical protein [bacterium]